MNDIIDGVIDLFGDIGYFIRWNIPEIALAVAIIAILVAITAAVVGHQARYEWFMEQCMEDHKEYECVILWRQGSRSSIIPIMIPSVSP